MDNSRIESDHQQTLELILDSIPIGIIFCDPQTRIQYINRCYAEYLGLDRRQVLGRPITDYIPDSRLSAVMESGRAELGDKCRIGDRDGHKVLIVNRVPVLDREGTLIGAVSQSLFGDPGELKRLHDKIEQLDHKVSLYRKRMQSAFSAKYSLEDILGQSAELIRAKNQTEHFARTESPVLITGATGTGKELFASALHRGSLRNQGPFVGINCAAIPLELFESELFGYTPGSFTGAHRDGKIGKIELADRGTLFLDEIGDLPLAAQVKMLRVLEDKTVYRLGAATGVTVDFRLVAATNQDLKSMIRRGTFREELYYRLSAMTVAIPPLNQRAEDIPILVRHTLGRMKRHVQGCSDRAMEVLMRYPWPGNVRELQNVLESAVSLCQGQVVELGDLPSEVASAVEHRGAGGNREEETTLSDSRATAEHRIILGALQKTGWNMRQAAGLLGISRATLYAKARKYHISRT